MPTANTTKNTTKNTTSDADRLVAVRERIALQTAPAWMPNEGAILTGELKLVRKGDSEYGAYPVLVMSVMSADPDTTPDGAPIVGGSFVAIHAFHSLLQSELLKVRPKPGDVLTFAYMGQQETNESKRNYAAAVQAANGDGAKVSKAEQDRTFYHLYVLMTGDGTTADAVQVEEFDWDADGTKAPSVD